MTIYNKEGYYVYKIKCKKDIIYEVFIPNYTYAFLDSAYKDVSLAIARCNYLHKNKIKIR